MSSKTFKFLNYVANGTGIKFGLSTDPSQFLRFDHSTAFFPGFGKNEQIQVLRNSIKLNYKTQVMSCESSCGVSVPVTATLTWSGPFVKATEVAAAIDDIVLALKAEQARLAAGFLPDTTDITLTSE